MSRPLVITVHGVNPDRTWQTKVHQVLEPHFRCAAISYREYDGLRGPVRAVVNPLLLCLALGTAAVAGWFGSSVDWRWGAGGGVLAVIILVLGLWTARRKRWRVLQEKYRPQYEAVVGDFDPSPHVVAHSMGTWLTGTALSLLPHFGFDRVVLVGSVLPRKYPWESLRKEKHHAFAEVRNEVGEADWVVWLVNLVHPFVREMGSAGLFGFKENGSLVHGTRVPYGPCPACVDAESLASIHNVALRDFGHSDLFLSMRHAAQLWLPFLWGISPHEFKEFMQLCVLVTRKKKAGSTAAAWQAEKVLRERVWSWTAIWGPRRPLEQCVPDHIARIVHFAALEDLAPDEKAAVLQNTDRAIRLMCHAVVDAAKEKNAAVETRRDDVVRALDPRVALDRAIFVIYEMQTTS